MNLDHSDDDDDDDTVGDELPNVMPCFTMRRIPVWTMLSRSTSDHSKASSLAVEANSTRQVYVDWKKLLLDHGQGKLNDPNASDRIIVYSTTASFAPEYEPRAVAQLALSMTELRV